MIKVENLVKRYGNMAAVNGISFEVERGEIVGFLGPNGAGKTTTMRILTGYLPASEGSARIAGFDVFSDSLEVRRRVGYLPEGVPLYPEMRVVEYLRHRAALKGVARSERRGRVEEVMERCAIGDVRRQLIGSLSKGYRQRVGLAEALVHDPPVLILDEPTIGLDPNQIRQTRQLIRELGREHTILLSTHILPEVEMVCSRALVVHRGRLVFQEKLSALAQQAATVVVEARAPGEEALAVLRQVSGVTDARWDGRQPVGRFELQTAAGADVREEVFRRIARNGWTLLELRRALPSLEEVFVELTTREGA